MKKIRKALTIVVIFSMMTSYAYLPVAQAASLAHVSDTVSTSAPSTVANHNFGFDTSVALGNNGYIEITFDALYSVISADGDITCPGSGVASGAASNIAVCTYASGLATGTLEFLVAGITNPPAGFYDVDIKTYQTGAVLEESANVINAVIDTVTVTAHVDSTLTFSVSGLDTGVTVNGDILTATSTATTTPFGDIEDGSQYIVGQELQVTTNASDGFQVTVTQNSHFDTAAGDIIDSFVEGSAVSIPTDWTSPVHVLSDETTWGHLGIATDDSDGLAGLLNYGDGFYTGLEVGTSTVVMAHTGPSVATEQDKGLAKIAYSVEISPLQEAGDYETTMTYIVTATY